MSYPFNVRVYGILIKDNRVLVADEFFHDTFLTKFPGGGLEFGEGPVDCLIRELKEELGIETRIIRHFYTTDFFLPSAFDSLKQIISIYYQVDSDESSSVVVSEFKPENKILKNGHCSFRWITLDKLSTDDFTFPADKKVAALILELRNGK
jgi:8-oxo-dGTP pyrophosphatase MutT (NUDIX family)